MLWANGKGEKHNMIKLALCDDDVSALDALGMMIDQYAVERKQKIEYAFFRSPLELIAKVERGAQFDVLFLDILMPGGSGINAAAEIRKYDNNIKIIFLTASAEFAVQSYSVEAFYYQLKPICRDDLFKLMDSAIATCEKEQANSLILRCKSGIARVELGNLEYCEVIHRTLFIHLSDGRVLESIGSLDELCRRLGAYSRFLRPHRSYLVNLDHVQTLSYQTITMLSMAKIPIPRGKYQDVKDAYLERAFENRQVII